MKREKIIMAVSALFSAAAGTFLHFLYQLSGENPFVALFSPVNESTWEHLKLLFFPVLLFSVIEYFVYGKKYKNFIPARFIGVCLGLVSIIVLFYTYSGIIGQDILAADILVFLISVAITYLYSYKVINYSDRFYQNSAVILSLAGVLILIAAFFVFTKYPLPIGLFAPPENM